MYAIVQTYDRNAVITEHMIRCYETLWPNHPFTFRIPFQDPARCLAGDRREYIRTDPGIKKTVLSLLEDLEDEAWIYWCIDDKYPVKLDVAFAEDLHERILQGEADGLSALLFCRPDNKRESYYLTGAELPYGTGMLLERRGYHRIWLHQFARVGTIRELFRHFPDQIPYAKVLDNYVAVINKSPDVRLYMTGRNHIVFGESMSCGILTRNCHDSLQAYGFEIPPNRLTEMQRSIMIGTL